MSLTSHLKNWKQSPIGLFLRNASTIYPVGQAPPYGAIGMTLDYRFRYSFAITLYQNLLRALFERYIQTLTFAV